MFDKPYLGFDIDSFKNIIQIKSLKSLSVLNKVSLVLFDKILLDSKFLL